MSDNKPLVHSNGSYRPEYREMFLDNADIRDEEEAMLSYEERLARAAGAAGELICDFPGDGEGQLNIVLSFDGAENQPGTGWHQRKL